MRTSRCARSARSAASGHRTRCSPSPTGRRGAGADGLCRSHAGLATDRGPTPPARAAMACPRGTRPGRGAGVRAARSSSQRIDRRPRAAVGASTRSVSDRGGGGAPGGACGAVVVTPSHVMAERLTRRLRRSGVPTALLPGDWALAVAGGVVAIGARAAVWAPLVRPGIVVVLDEHDEALREERMPCWRTRGRGDRTGSAQRSPLRARLVPADARSPSRRGRVRRARGPVRVPEPLGTDRRIERAGWARWKSSTAVGKSQAGTV